MQCAPTSWDCTHYSASRRLGFRRASITLGRRGSSLCHFTLQDSLLRRMPDTEITARCDRLTGSSPENVCAQLLSLLQSPSIQTISADLDGLEKAGFRAAFSLGMARLLYKLLDGYIQGLSNWLPLESPTSVRMNGSREPRSNRSYQLRPGRYEQEFRLPLHKTRSFKRTLWRLRTGPCENRT